MRDFEDSPFRPGDLILGKYEVKHVLGRGGHAFVYQCGDAVMADDVAVKVIPNPPDKDILQRALDEARFLYRLNHPHIVRVHTAEVISGKMVCIVMELLKGVSVRQLLAVLGPLSVIEALMIARQVALGAAAAHESDAKAIHRDIKPDNIIVRPPDNHVKLVDFGIAKFLGYGVETGDRTRFHGTPRYMSPESLRGETVTPLSDMYQIGTVVFEMILGIPPVLVGVEEENFNQVAHAQLARPTPLLQPLLPNVPHDVDYLIQRATEKDPGRRFPSMRVFIAAIDKLLAECLAMLPLEARRVRYVDENVIRVSKALLGKFGADALKRPRTGPTPLPLIEVPGRPFEIWDTDMVSNPGFAECTPAPALETVEPESRNPAAISNGVDTIRESATFAASAEVGARVHVAPAPPPAREQRIRSHDASLQPSIEIRVQEQDSHRAPEPSGFERGRSATPASMSRTVQDAASPSAAPGWVEPVPTWKAVLFSAALAGVGLAGAMLLLSSYRSLGMAVIESPAGAVSAVAHPSPHASQDAPSPSERTLEAAPLVPDADPAMPEPIPSAAVDPASFAQHPAPSRAAATASSVAPAARVPPQRRKRAAAPAASSAAKSSDAERVRERARRYREERENLEKPLIDHLR